MTLYQLQNKSHIKCRSVWQDDHEWSIGKDGYKDGRGRFQGVILWNRLSRTRKISCNISCCWGQRVSHSVSLTYGNKHKTKSQYYRKEITPVLPIAGQKFLQYFVGHLEFFAVFQKFYLFIPRFLTETLTMLSGTLAGTQWFRILPLYHFARRTAMTKQVAGH